MFCALELNRRNICVVKNEIVSVARLKIKDEIDPVMFQKILLSSWNVYKIGTFHQHKNKQMYDLNIV